MQNFTEHSAVGSLEKSEGNLIAGTLVDVLENEQQTEMLLDLGLRVLQEPLEMELEKFALAQCKAPDELSEEEFAAVMARLSDQFLGKMMNLLLQTQDIEQWMEFTKKTPAHEDFNEKILLNFDKINFERRWHHLRTRIGRLFELDVDSIQINKDQFIHAIRKFMEMQTLTAPLPRELIDHIDVYETEGTGTNRKGIAVEYVTQSA